MSGGFAERGTFPGQGRDMTGRIRVGSGWAIWDKGRSIDLSGDEAVVCTRAKTAVARIAIAVLGASGYFSAAGLANGSGVSIDGSARASRRCLSTSLRAKWPGWVLGA